MSATSLNTLIQLVMAEMGSTLLPEMALPQLVDHDPRLVAVRLDEPGPHRELAFVIRATYPNFSNIELLKHLFHEGLLQARTSSPRAR